MENSIELLQQYIKETSKYYMENRNHTLIAMRELKDFEKRILIDEITEIDFLRFICEIPSFFENVIINIKIKDLKLNETRKLYELLIIFNKMNELNEIIKSIKILSKNDENFFLFKIFEKRINIFDAEKFLKDCIYNILIRNYLDKREEIAKKIHSGIYSDEENLELIRKFSLIKKPEIIWEENKK